jgi:hypothetical protein
MKNQKPLFVDAKLIMRITGRSKSYAYNLLKKIKIYFNKAPHQLVTVDEYAEFHGIPKEVILSYL